MVPVLDEVTPLLIVGHHRRRVPEGGDQLYDADAVLLPLQVSCGEPPCCHAVSGEGGGDELLRHSHELPYPLFRGHVRKETESEVAAVTSLARQGRLPRGGKPEEGAVREILARVEVTVRAVLKEALAPPLSGWRFPPPLQVHVLTVDKGPAGKPLDGLAVTQYHRVVLLLREGVRHGKGELPSDGQFTPAGDDDVIPYGPERHHLPPVPSSDVEFHKSLNLHGSTLTQLCSCMDARTFCRSFTVHMLCMYSTPK